MKSPACVVVTAAPGVLLSVRSPLEVLVTSGAEVEIPDTSQTVISTWVGESSNVGVTTVALGFEFTAYQISDEPLPSAAFAPAET